MMLEFIDKWFNVDKDVIAQVLFARKPPSLAVRVSRTSLFVI